MAQTWTKDVLNKAVIILRDRLNTSGFTDLYELKWSMTNTEYGISLLLPWSISEKGKVWEWAELPYNLRIASKPIDNLEDMLRTISKQIKKNKDNIIDFVGYESSDGNDRAYEVTKNILQTLTK